MRGPRSNKHTLKDNVILSNQKGTIVDTPEQKALYLLGMISFFVVCGIASVFVKRRAKRRLQDSVDAVSQAVTDGEYSKAVAAAKELLCTTYANEIRGLKKNQMRLIQQAFSSETDVVEHLRQIYKNADADVPEETLQELTDVIAKQQSMIADNQNFSRVHGGPKKEVMASFEEIQYHKEKLARSLPTLA